MNSKITDPQIIQQMIKTVSHWYHQIQFPGGIVSPGINNSAEVLNYLSKLGLPSDCTGLRVLDIGCRDGYFAFEMEKRGAEVIGIDYQPPHVTGFDVSQQILGSNVTYLVDNIYNLSPEAHGLFDVVLFLGVLYHLRNPMLAIDRIRSVTKPDGLLFVETQIIDGHFMRKSGNFSNLSDVAPELLDIPIIQFFPRDSLNGDATNKMAPNMKALQAMFEEGQFQVLGAFPHPTGIRGYLKGRAVIDGELEYFRRIDTAQNADMYRNTP